MAATQTRAFKNFIGGSWVDAASGETFESFTPATGEPLGTFPRSGAEDVDRAVAAAKAAFADWRLVPAPKRGTILLRFAQSARARQGRADRADEPGDGQGARGGGRRRARGDRHVRSTWPARAGACSATRRPRSCRDKFQMIGSHADRRRRRDHAVELPDRDPGLEDRARARLRQHGRLQAGRGHAAARAALRRAARRGGCPAGRRQSRARLRRGGGRQDRPRIPTCR